MFIKDKYKNDLAQQFAMITFYCAYTKVVKFLKIEVF